MIVRVGLDSTSKLTAGGIEQARLDVLSGPGLVTSREGCVTDQGLRFDAAVPVEVIGLSAPELDGPEVDQSDIISQRALFAAAGRCMPQRKYLIVFLYKANPATNPTAVGKIGACFAKFNRDKINPSPKFASN